MGKAFDALNKGNDTRLELDSVPLSTSAPKGSAKRHGDWTSRLIRLDHAKLAIRHERFNGTQWLRELNKVATMFHGTQTGDGGSIIGFTSPHNAAGTSSIAFHIARLFAASDTGARAMLLDLSLSPAEAQDHASHTPPDTNLDCFNAGLTAAELQSPAMPSHLLGFLQLARSRYQWIILDLPPLNHNPALYSLAKESDGVALIAKAGTTRLPTLKALSQEMDQLGVTVLGVILNHRRYPIPDFLLRLI